MNEIALLARSRTRDGRIALWGILGDDALEVRVAYADGMVSTLPARYGFIAIPARYGFIATGAAGNPPREVTALAKDGSVLGSASAEDRSLTECDWSSCGVVIAAQG
jgi:hypothetical protein